MTVSDKLLDKLAKMKRQIDGERAIGNIEAAEAFAEALNRMLLTHEIDMVEVDRRTAEGAASVEEPIIQHQVDLTAQGIKFKQARVAWQEQLASIVARNNMCRILVRQRTNFIWFVGTKTHATVAEYTWATLVNAATRMAAKEHGAYYRICYNAGRVQEAHGFRNAWLTAFVKRIDERLTEARAKIVAESSSTALVPINRALARTDDYMRRFSRYVGAVRGSRPTGIGSAIGAERGRAAADGVAIGQRGVGSGTGRKQIT